MATSWRSPVGATPEGASPKCLQAWCKQHKLSWPKCEITLSPTTGRCVVAVEDIAAGEVVVSVPDDAVLMVENCSIAETLVQCGLAKPADDAMLEVQGLVLAVMHEKARGAASKWCDYLNFLPASMEHMPMYWSDCELQELRGTVAFDKQHGRVQHVSDAPTKVSELFEELVTPFLNDHPDIAAAVMPSGDRERAWELYRWATAVVSSYSFILGDDHYQAMVPAWDALNHVTGAVNVRLHHDAEGGALQMVATQDIPARAEVVNNYGALSTAELLRCYGFVEAANPNNHAQVPAQFLLRAAAAQLPSADQGGTRGRKRARDGGEAEEGDCVRPANGRTVHADGAEAGSDDEEEEHGASSGEEEGSSDEGEEEEEEQEEGEDDDHDEGEASGSEAELDFDLEDDTDAEEAAADSSSQARGAQAGPGPGSSTSRGSSGSGGSNAGTRLPRLSVAMELVPDWEARWQLCSALKLLPASGVFKVGAGAACLPGDMAAMLLVLLMSEQQCGELGRLLQEWGQGQPDRDNAAQDIEAISPPAQVLLATLLSVVSLMLSRYTCSLEEDKQLLSRLDTLAPRLQAAVVARSSEKECLQALRQQLQQEGAAERLRQQAASTLLAAVLLRAERRRAKVAAGGTAGAQGVPEEAGPSGAHAGSHHDAGCHEHCHHPCSADEPAHEHVERASKKHHASRHGGHKDGIAACSTKHTVQTKAAPAQVAFSFGFDVGGK